MASSEFDISPLLIPFIVQDNFTTFVHLEEDRFMTAKSIGASAFFLNDGTFLMRGHFSR